MGFGVNQELKFGTNASAVPWVLACLCSAKRPWASDAGCRCGQVEFWNSLVVGHKSEGGVGQFTLSALEGSSAHLGVEVRGVGHIEAISQLDLDASREDFLIEHPKSETFIPRGATRRGVRDQKPG